MRTVSYVGHLNILLQRIKFMIVLVNILKVAVMQLTKVTIKNKHTILFKCYNDKKIATEQLNQQNILFYIDHHFLVTEP